MYTESEKRKMKEAQHVDMTMEDPEVEALRQRRLEALKNASKARAQHLADGHGELREIVEEEFLREVPSTQCVVVVVEGGGGGRALPVPPPHSLPPHPTRPTPLSAGTLSCTSSTRSSCRAR
jgi:hypothetical protein